MVLFLKKLFQIGLIGSLFLMTACVPTGVTPAPEGFLETVIAATMQAIPTNTLAPTLTPTLTARPTRALLTEEPSPTPFPSVTPFPTFTLTPTLTATPTEVGAGSRVGVYQGDGNFACMVMNQKPLNFEKFKPGSLISVTWTLKNVGAVEWSPSRVEIVFEDGQKMYAYSQTQEFPFVVQPGETRDIVIVLRAPDKGGDYRATFGLQRGGSIFCRLIIGVSVR